MLTTLSKDAKGYVTGREFVAGEVIDVEEVGDQDGRPWARIVNSDGIVERIDPGCLAAPWNDQEAGVKDVAALFTLEAGTLTKAIQDGRVMARKIARDYVTTEGAVVWALKTGKLRQGYKKSDKELLLDILFGISNKEPDLKRILSRTTLFPDYAGPMRVVMVEGLLMAKEIAFSEALGRWVANSEATAREIVKTVPGAKLETVWADAYTFPPKGAE